MQHHCHAIASEDFLGLGHASRNNSHVDGERVILVQYIVLKHDSSEKKKIFRFANRFHLIHGIVENLHSVYQAYYFYTNFINILKRRKSVTMMNFQSARFETEGIEKKTTTTNKYLIQHYTL